MPVSYQGVSKHIDQNKQIYATKALQRHHLGLKVGFFCYFIKSNS